MSVLELWKLNYLSLLMFRFMCFVTTQPEFWCLYLNQSQGQERYKALLKFDTKWFYT